MLCMDLMAKSRSKISRQPVKKSPVRASGASPRANPRPQSAASQRQMGLCVRRRQGRSARRMRNLLGGKGAGLAEMAHLGLPVPPGFTITTEVCTYFYEHGKTYPKDLKAQVEAALGRGRPHHRQEIRRCGKSAAGFGALRRARLDAGHDGYGAQSRPQRRDGRRRLRKNPATGASRWTATGASSPCIPTWCSASSIITSRKSSTTHKDRNGYTLDTDLDADDWEQLVARYKERVEEETGKPFPQDPHAQLWGAIGAVFGSWMNQRAITYRRLHDIPESWGTAVNVQAMVFGNMGETSATGVAFTRNPSTGEKKLYGEFLINAQGEDVVAGIRTPQEITEAARKEAGSDKPSMEAALPDAFAELQAHPRRARAALPRHAGSRIHRRAGQAVDAADAQRQAHRAGGAAHRGRARAGETDHQRRSGGADRSRRARSAAASDHRSRCRAQDHRHRPAGFARRGLRRNRVLLRRSRAAQEPGPQSHPGARRDLAGRHPRHARRRRHSDDARRHDLACRRGGARHGQALRLRRRLAARRLPRADHDGRRHHAEEGRYAHHRRLDRPGARRQSADAASRRSPANSPP